MKKLDKTIGEVWKDKYVVPLYQRNFAWTEKEINLLLQDAYDSFVKDPLSNYYIGSLVVLRRQDGTLEVIDGQQRLTVLHMLCRVLGIISSPHLTYDSRPEVERFFDDLFAEGESLDLSKKDKTKIFRLAEGLDAIRTTRLHTAPGKANDKEFFLCDCPYWPLEEKQRFTQYLANKVILVRVELPSDTDVAAYFEIMNNRGEQLQEHEIIKAIMMEKLKEEQERGVFSTVWDACSQMNIPIQRTLSSYRLNRESPLFGSDFEELHLEFLPHYQDSDRQTDFIGIDKILESSYGIDEQSNTDVEEKYESIVDFPNFLMLLFKSYVDDTELNDKYLLSRFKEIKDSFTPMEFLRKMLTWRVRFDKYIVKTVGEGEDDDNQKWILQRPYSSPSNDGALKFKNTFYADFERDPSDDETITAIQSNVIMAESMLQVTFRNKKYKNWLFDILQWMENEYHGGISITSDSLLRFIHEWMLSYYLGTIQKKDYLFALGTDTPYYVFNFIDYLFWFESKKGKDAWHKNNIAYIDHVKDFKFRYYNSVEHHYPQSYGGDRAIIDSIGNLCLISKSKNSSLNDKSPTEKARGELDGMAPKRKIMYVMTNQKKSWEMDAIVEHGQDVIKLLDKSQDILGL